MRFLAVPEPSEQQLIEQAICSTTKRAATSNDSNVIPVKVGRGARPRPRHVPCAGSSTDTDTEEPARHTDRYIQTALYPHELETG